MKSYMILLATCISFLLLPSAQGKADSVTDNLNIAMERLAVDKDAQTLCAITNAGYADLSGKLTVSYLDDIQVITGCTIGSGRLLSYHRPAAKPLHIVLFDKASYKCVNITTTDQGTTISQPLDLRLETISDEQKWAAISTEFGADAFTITAFAHQWAAGAPNDFMRCAEFHNHICPGVTSGYFMSNYILQRIKPAPGASCTFISCPMFCGDDAIQILLDLTVGKKSCVAKNLTAAQLQQLNNENVSGIFIVTEAGGGKSVAYIFEYDWDAAEELTGSAELTGIASRIKNTTGLIPYYNTPERLVHVLAKQEITAEEKELMVSAGTNPYEILHFTK